MLQIYTHKYLDAAACMHEVTCGGSRELREASSHLDTNAVKRVLTVPGVYLRFAALIASLLET